MHQPKCLLHNDQYLIFFFEQTIKNYTIMHKYTHESEIVSHSVYLTLHNPKDCSLPGYFVYGVLQARILEWIAIPFSKGSS